MFIKSFLLDPCGGSSPLLGTKSQNESRLENRRLTLILKGFFGAGFFSFPRRPPRLPLKIATKMPRECHAALAVFCLFVAGCASQSSIDDDVSDNELRRQIELEDAREEFLIRKEICTQRGGVMMLPVKTTRILTRRYSAMDYRRARCR